MRGRERESRDTVTCAIYVAPSLCARAHWQVRRVRGLVQLRSGQERWWCCKVLYKCVCLCVRERESAREVEVREEISSLMTSDDLGV